tara:strand:- start:343 stop:927 length:585 start_codon:yes stop_codon:yes gene_type:complete
MTKAKRKMIKTACHRCKGGKWWNNPFACFTCNDRKWIMLPYYSPEERAKMDARNAKARAKSQAKRAGRFVVKRLAVGIGQAAAAAAGCVGDVLAEAGKPADRHVGTVGKRETRRYRVEFLARGLCKLIDQATGGACVVFQTYIGPAGGGLAYCKAGGLYWIRATPKNHGEYDGRASTILARPVLVAVPKKKSKK